VTVLILNHRPLDRRPIGRWLQGVGDLVMVTTHAALAASPAADRALFSRIIPVGAYLSVEVDTAARSLAARYRPERIASCHEFDLVRVAVLRESLKLDGQSVASALAFRDKRAMRCTGAAAVNQPAFRVPESIDDAVEFAGKSGYPVVIKPRRGGGAAGIIVAATAAELAQGLALSSSAPGGVLVESWIDAPLFHVDGICEAGQVRHCWSGQYGEGALDAVTRAVPRTSVMLDASDGRRTALDGFARRVLSVFPHSGAVFAFHLEAWIDASGAVLLCEVSSRTGGSPILEAYAHAFGVELAEQNFRGQAGLPLTCGSTPLRPARYTGWVRFTVGQGHFAPPDPAGRPPTALFRQLLPPGTGRSGPLHVADAAAFAVVDGSTPEQARTRLNEVVAWWEASRVWS
jgi:Carbamoyl-phosphate synthase L chain, ATP binding domain